MEAIRQEHHKSLNVAVKMAQKARTHASDGEGGGEGGRLGLILFTTHLELDPF